MLRIGFLCLFALVLTLQAATPAEKLEYVVVMSRHGNRSPLWSEAQQNSYSAQPWPKWDVPTGYLTAHGRTGMELMGGYYRDYFTRQNLLPTADVCLIAGKFYFWSDTDERDIDSGHAIASRLFPGCAVAMHEIAQGNKDPLFTPLDAGVGKEDRKAEAAAVAARVGNLPAAFLARYRPQFQLMQTILLGCDPGKTCAADRIAGKKLLVGPAANSGSGSLEDLLGPLAPASSIADMFLLEYAEGMKPGDIGWGRVNKSNLRDLLLLQEAAVDLDLRTPYLARANGSNLMSHILKSMQQAASGSAVQGSLGAPGDKGLVFLGHDANESILEGMLQTAWNVAGYAPNSRPPGSSLIFELWKNTHGGRYSVRTWFVTQTLDQLHDNTPLSLKAPPARVALVIPGCGGATCDWDKFQSLVAADIDPAFVSNLPLSEAKTQWMK